jgi:hypothetical protein
MQVQEKMSTTASNTKSNSNAVTCYCSAASLYAPQMKYFLHDVLPSNCLAKFNSVYPGDRIITGSKVSDPLGGNISKGVFAYIESLYFAQLISADDEVKIAVKFIRNIISNPCNQKLLAIIKNPSDEYKHYISNEIIRKVCSSLLSNFEDLVSMVGNEQACEYVLDLLYAFAIIQFRIFYVNEKPYSTEPIIYKAFHFLAIDGYFDNTDNLLQIVFTRITELIASKKTATKKGTATKAEGKTPAKKGAAAKKVSSEVERDEQTYKDVNNFDSLTNGDSTDPFAV